MSYMPLMADMSIKEDSKEGFAMDLVTTYTRMAQNTEGSGKII